MQRQSTPHDIQDELFLNVLMLTGGLGLLWMTYRYVSGLISTRQKQHAQDLRKIKKNEERLCDLNNNKSKPTITPIKRNTLTFDRDAMSESEDSVSSSVSSESEDNVESYQAPTIKKKYKTNNRPTQNRFFSPYHASSQSQQDMKHVETQAPIQSEVSNVYDIRKGNKVIGTISIAPNLISKLSDEQYKVVKKLCERGKVIEGSTQGKDGLVYINGMFKLKKAKDNVRFYAYQKIGGAINEFEVCVVKTKHENKKIVSTRDLPRIKK